MRSRIGEEISTRCPFWVKNRREVEDSGNVCAAANKAVEVAVEGRVEAMVPVQGEQILEAGIEVMESGGADCVKEGCI